MFEHIGTLYSSNSLFKFVIDDTTNNVHIILFDEKLHNTFDINLQEFEEFKDLEDALEFKDSKFKIKDLDCITKYEDDNYYTLVERDDKYIINYSTNKREYCKGTKVLASQWCVKKEGEKKFTHVLSIYANYKCDEDQGKVNKKASDKYCDVLYRILNYEEKIGSDFYINYCHMNTCDVWRW